MTARTLHCARLAALLATLGACRDEPPNRETAGETTGEDTATPAETAGSRLAFARIAPAEGQNVSGTAVVSEVEGGLNVFIRLDGLTPGSHGLHIHEIGDCSAPAFQSAGEHFNPTHSRHGAPVAPQHHGGDLGNITADDSGHAELRIRVEGMNLQPGSPSSFEGRTVVVHAKPDDMKTQPSGDSGARIGCGVIQTISREPRRVG